MGQAYKQADPFGVQAILISTLVASVVYAALLQTRLVRVTKLAYVQLAGDLLLVSALVYTFGGVYSPFSMFYPLVIVLAAIHLGGQGPATTFATAAFVVYVSLLAGIYFDWNWPPRVQTLDPNLTLRLGYNVVVALVGFYTVALLGSTLARRTRLVEAALEEKTERLASLSVVYQDVIQSIVSGLITTDARGIVSSVNLAGRNLLKIEEDELLGLPITGSRLFRDGATWQRSRDACDATGKAVDEVEIERDGARVTIGYSLTRLKDAQGQHQGYILIFQDLTEKRQLQNELRVKDRMAAVGELAAGIAHEVGNPLTAISGSAQMLSSAMSADASGAQLLRIILKESQRLDRTIKGFLRFARPRDSALVRFDVVEVLREHLALLRNSPEITPQHRLELETEEDPVMILADADQVSQILWNLSRNATRAMPDGGTLKFSGFKSGEGTFVLEVADTGRGMTAEQQARLFEPFQSYFDRGMGVGMSIVYRIVQEHGGRLRVESAEGRGTTITVELPLTPSLPAAGGEQAEDSP